MSKYESPVKSPDLEHYLMVQGMNSPLRKSPSIRKFSSSRRSSRKTPLSWNTRNDRLQKEWKDAHFHSFVAHVKEFVKYLKETHTTPSLSEYNKWMKDLEKNNHAYFVSIPAATAGNAYSFRERVDYAGKLYNSPTRRSTRKRKRNSA